MKRKAPPPPLVRVTSTAAEPRRQVTADELWRRFPDRKRLSCRDLGLLTDADLLRDYLRAVEKGAIHVLRKPDALPESLAAAQRVLDALHPVRAFATRLPPGDVPELWRAMVLILDAEGMAANELWAHDVADAATRKGKLAKHRHRGKPRHDWQTIRRVLDTSSSNKEAARRLNVSVRTISTYKKNAKD